MNNPTKHLDELLAKLIRLSMGLTEEELGAVSGEAWQQLYKLAHQEALIGLCWQGVTRLSREQQPSMGLALRWAGEAEQISGLNKLQNGEAARLTQLFAQAGRKSAVLKGQANARLYPNPLSRQPGDIDIWVEGGRESVVSLLVGMGLLDKRPVTADIGKKGKATMSYHHVHLPPTADGVVVEVHFRPSSGNFDPITNRRLQRWLEQELASGIAISEEGFGVPSVRFALVMQLAHIQRHFLGGGVGLRQITDYCLLLRSATDEDRREVADCLERLGLKHIAGALMWTLGEVFRMDDGTMLCNPDEKRGRWLLREVMEGGNFGRYAERQQLGLWQRVMKSRLRSLRLMRFDLREACWVEANYWTTIVRTLPVRIKYRKLSLRGMGG